MADRALTAFGFASLSIGMLFLGAFGTPARADVCFDLSYQRNAIFKAAGYCFKTAQQIENFGNAGCMYDNQADVPLSARQRAQIADLVRQERELGCR
jgi:hypothetical protein